MKMLLYNTPEGLKPMYDEDYEAKKKLRLGVVYTADVKLARNYEFLKKYMVLIKTAWEYLNEGQCAFFGNNVNTFRKTLEVTAGFFEPVYDLTGGTWHKAPRSIAFDKMTEDEFHDVYERVKDVIFKCFLTNIDVYEFMSNLSNF